MRPLLFALVWSSRREEHRKVATTAK